MSRIYSEKGGVDFAIITIRSDEYKCVLDHIPNRETLHGKQYYAYSRVQTKTGDDVGVAVVRSLAQGHGSAHDITRDIIDDLDPAWILLVGIAGGLPSDDYSLGDVLLFCESIFRQGNEPIRELAQTPLLLTLLCLVFETTGHLPADRASL
jgi:nucleoside phosphorylase